MLNRVRNQSGENYTTQLVGGSCSSAKPCELLPAGPTYQLPFQLVSRFSGASRAARRSGRRRCASATGFAHRVGPFFSTVLTVIPSALAISFVAVPIRPSLRRTFFSRSLSRQTSGVVTLTRRRARVRRAPAARHPGMSRQRRRRERRRAAPRGNTLSQEHHPEAPAIVNSSTNAASS